MTANADRTEAAAFIASDRLASLGDSMFGVAMTLLATTMLPSLQALHGPATDVLRDLGGQIGAVVLSFAISANYWVTQQQRLAMTRSLTARQTLLHMCFLFLIVLLPISTALQGNAGSGRQMMLEIFGAHLVLIALFNLLLWIEVHRVVVVRVQIVRGGLALILFLIAVALAALRPAIAIYAWFAVFLVPVAADRVVRRLYGA